MLVIGLTGGIGSGKSTVAEMFREKGIEVIDADLLAREVVEPGQPALARIADHFGSAVIDGDGSLRRGRLRELVFASPEQRLWLEALLHPLIDRRIRARISECRSAYCVLMSPLLLETAQKDLVDRVLVVDVSKETQLERTLRRDQSSRQTIEAIIAAQASREQRRLAASDLLSNEGDPADLQYAVERLHRQYLELAAKPR